MHLSVQQPNTNPSPSLACWNQAPKMRPTFTDIRVQLENSSFNVINMEQFQKMKRNWFDEIENIWESLKEKEKELESREVEARRKEEETKRKEEEVELMKRVLKQQSEKLRRREIEVVSRELNVLLHQQQAQLEGGGKQQKRRLARKKSITSSSTKIGYPQNFCHNLTITTSQDDYSLPLLQARALNKTCKFVHTISKRPSTLELTINIPCRGTWHQDTP